MCGFVGIISRDSDVVYDLFFALHTLQHRGQDGTGILTFNGSNFHLKKDVGLVDDVFDDESMKELKGKLGIAHVRYPTISSDPYKNVQPFLIDYPTDIGFCHNGNLVNYEELKKELEVKHNYKMSSTSDGEVILALFAEELKSISKGGDISADHIFSSLSNIEKKLNGGYSCLSILRDWGLVAGRAPLSPPPPPPCSQNTFL